MNYVPKKITLIFDVSDMSLIECEQACRGPDISWMYGRRAKSSAEFVSEDEI